MKNYIAQFLKSYAYPVEAEEVILSVYDKLKGNEDFNKLVETFYADEAVGFETIKDSLEKISNIISVDFYTVQLVFFICLTTYLENMYKKAGVDEKIYFDTVEDLKYKLAECYDVEKVWGVIATGWFVNLFRMRTYALGRLEFNMGVHTGDDLVVGGRSVKDGDKVINIHIPSSGKPFDTASRLDSYEKAYYFFKDRFGDNEPVFRCETWLIYPPNKELLGEKSNIVSFMDDFNIVSSYEYPDTENLWRIFGADAELPPEQLPRNTSMQRAFADWFMKGNRLGAGIGYFVYDPINKVILK